MLLLFKIFSNIVDSSVITGNLSLNVKQCATRKNNLFYLKSHSTNYANNSPIIKKIIMNILVILIYFVNHYIMSGVKLL